VVMGADGVATAVVELVVEFIVGSPFGGFVDGVNLVVGNWLVGGSLVGG
jgi:hypothetical protein